MINSAAIVTPLAPLAAANMDEGATSTSDAHIRNLTQGLAAGDESAFREFHQAYFNRLLRYLFVASRGDELAARDALQETMTRVVRYARRFDTEAAFWNWLTVLARSAVVDAGRKRLRYWRLLTRYALSWISRQPESTSSDPENDLTDLLEECLDSLPKLDRELVEAKYFSNVSMRDLAAKYDLTERAVESRLLRARRQLRVDLLLKMKDEKRIR